MNYKELAEQALDYIVEQRRWCHQNPELSLEEVQTTEHIAAELQKMGYTEIQRFPDHTGLCAMLRGGKAEKACRTVALRALRGDHCRCRRSLRLGVSTRRHAGADRICCKQYVWECERNAL